MNDDIRVWRGTAVQRYAEELKTEYVRIRVGSGDVRGSNVPEEGVTIGFGMTAPAGYSSMHVHISPSGYEELARKMMLGDPVAAERAFLTAMLEQAKINAKQA